MDERRNRNKTPAPTTQVEGVRTLASKAIDFLATRNSQPSAANRSLTEAAANMHAAAMSPHSARLSDLCAELLDAGISPVEMSETLIPQVARALGDQWCSDELGFAGVTIGCARLTHVLRKLDQLDDTTVAPGAMQVLVLVGEDVYHTLGATVLSGMIRRQGYGTELWIGADPATLAQHLAQSEFDAVFISASCGESLETIRRLVSSCQAASPTLPVAVGGTIIDEVGSAEEVRTLTGATIATKNPNEALKLCETVRHSSQTHATSIPPKGGH